MPSFVARLASPSAQRRMHRVCHPSVTVSHIVACTMRLMFPNKEIYNCNSTFRPPICSPSQATHTNGCCTVVYSHVRWACASTCCRDDSATRLLCCRGPRCAARAMPVALPINQQDGSRHRGVGRALCECQCQRTAPTLHRRASASDMRSLHEKKDERSIFAAVHRSNR